MRYLYIYTAYWAVLAIPFTPITPNAGFRDLKNALRAMKWPFYLIPDRHDPRLGCGSSIDTIPEHCSQGESFILHVGGHKLLARSGLVGINQLCSLKLPQSPCSQGNGGRKGKNSLGVCGHKKIRCWRNDWNSPSEAKADATSGLMQSRRPRPVCSSPIVWADPAVNVNAAAVRRCINATAAPSKLQPPSRLQSQPHRTRPSRGHISPRRLCDGDPLLRGETMQLRRNKG